MKLKHMECIRVCWSGICVEPSNKCFTHTKMDAEPILRLDVVLS